MKQTAAASNLATPLQFVKGVGPQRAGQLGRKGLRTVEDALFFVPLRHEDRISKRPRTLLEWAKKQERHASWVPRPRSQCKYMAGDIRVN